MVNHGFRLGVRYQTIRPTSIVTALMMMAIFIFTGMGCSKEELKQAYEDAKIKTEAIAASTVEAVEERLPPSGSLTLRSTPEIEPTSSATVEIISIGDGRPNVWQVLTYDPGNSTKPFPAMMLHGSTSAGSIDSLAGTKLECEMYLRTSNSAPMAMTQIGKPAMLTFGSRNPEDPTVTATLDAVELMGSDGQPFQVLGGDLVAVVVERN